MLNGAEKLVTRSLAEMAVRHPRPDGRRRSVACLYRWAPDGCRGVVLETTAIDGAVLGTTDEALEHFFAELTAKRTRVGRRRTAARSRRLVERADARLRAAGL